jgi:hypothetical protein
MSEKTHAGIPLSFFEYRATYQEPFFAFHKLYQDVCQTVFRSLRPWNISLEAVSLKLNPVNFGEVQASFTLFGGRLAFNVGLGASVLVVKDPNWSEAELITNIAKAGMNAVISSTGVTVEKQKASIAMHVKPDLGSAKDFVLGFARVGASELLGSSFKAYGISVYKDDTTWVVDASASYTDALFIRIDHVSGAEANFEKIASKLRDDESKILDLLRLEVD